MPEALKFRACLSFKITFSIRPSPINFHLQWPFLINLRSVVVVWNGHRWSLERYQILFSYLITLSLFQIVYFLEKNIFSHFCILASKLTTIRSENKIGKKFCQIRHALRYAVIYSSSWLPCRTQSSAWNNKIIKRSLIFACSIRYAFTQ